MAFHLWLAKPVMLQTITRKTNSSTTLRPPPPPPKKRQKLSSETPLAITRYSEHKLCTVLLHNVDNHKAHGWIQKSQTSLVRPLWKCQHIFSRVVLAEGHLATSATVGHASRDYWRKGIRRCTHTSTLYNHGEHVSCNSVHILTCHTHTHKKQQNEP